MTMTNASAITTRPGKPYSSAMPVPARAVGLGRAARGVVCVCAATALVNAAATVEVAAICVLDKDAPETVGEGSAGFRVGVAEGCPTGGVDVGVGESVAVGKIDAWKVAVNDF